MVLIDGGAWKKNVRKYCPSTRIGWMGLMERLKFCGNDKVIVGLTERRSCNVAWNEKGF